MNSSRIIVQYNPWGRMGNRMFLYAFGKLLAIKKQCKFYCEPLPNFINTQYDIPFTTFLNNPLYTKNYGNNYVDYKQLLEYPTDIIINSYLQKAEYYTPYKELIKNWFWLDLTNKPKPENNELVIHIRETDYSYIKKNDSNRK